MTDPLEKHAKEQERLACTHPNLKFGRMGFQLSCDDCKRRWIIAMEGFDIADFTYVNPRIPDGDLRRK